MLAILGTVFVVWSNYIDIQLIKGYRKREQKRKPECSDSECPVYPWWHGGFPHGGFHVGPWRLPVSTRQQYYYHPHVGWYASPFSLL